MPVPEPRESFLFPLARRLEIAADTPAADQAEGPYRGDGRPAAKARLPTELAARVAAPYARRIDVLLDRGFEMGVVQLRHSWPSVIALVGLVSLRTEHRGPGWMRRPNTLYPLLTHPEHPVVAFVCRSTLKLYTLLEDGRALVTATSGESHNLPRLGISRVSNVGSVGRTLKRHLKRVAEAEAAGSRAIPGPPFERVAAVFQVESRIAHTHVWGVLAFLAWFLALILLLPLLRDSSCAGGPP